MCYQSIHYYPYSHVNKHYSILFLLIHISILFLLIHISTCPSLFLSCAYAEHFFFFCITTRTHISTITLHYYSYSNTFQRPTHIFRFINTQNIGWRRPTGCLILVGHFLQKSPIISASSAENDLQLKASYGFSPPYSEFITIPAHILTIFIHYYRVAKTHRIP